MIQSSRRQHLTEQQQPGQGAAIQDNHEFKQYRYRWVVVLLTGYMFLVNGLANNMVIPIASKLKTTYEVSQLEGNFPVTVSFLIYTLMNFPANHIIDLKGLRFSFLVGGSLYAVGVFLYVMINKNYIYTIFGSILVASGQPFIINCPAKVATYWFFNKNRPLATAIMTGLLLIGTGIGYIFPTIIISEDSVGEDAKTQIFYLYAGQFMMAAIGLLLIYLFMKKQPPTLPSIGAEQQKTGLKQSLKIIKSNRNLWKFFAAYILIYGTLLTFGSTVNLFMKVYNFTDIQIALFAVLLLVSGVVGSICWSLYLRKTSNYRLTIRAIPTVSLVIMIIICIFLNVFPQTVIIFILGAIIGFSITPLMPISYDLGCQMCFPVGEAQVTGILNGGAMLLTFFLTLIITSTMPFETTSQSLIAMIIYIVLIFFGTVFFYFVKIDLKRRNAETTGHTIELPKDADSEINETIKKYIQEKPTEQRQQQLQEQQHKKNENLLEPVINIQMQNVPKVGEQNDDGEVYI